MLNKFLVIATLLIFMIVGCSFGTSPAELHSAYIFAGDQIISKKSSINIACDGLNPLLNVDKCIIVKKTYNNIADIYSLVLNPLDKAVTDKANEADWTKEAVNGLLIIINQEDLVIGVSPVLNAIQVILSKGSLTIEEKLQQTLLALESILIIMEEGGE